MLVKTLLKRKGREIITAGLTTGVAEAMEMLIRNKISCLPVLADNGDLVGVITDKDIFRRIHDTNGAYHDLTVSDVMDDRIVIGLLEDEIADIATLMDHEGVRHVLIVEDKQLIGLISQRDIMRTQAKNREIENRYLNLYMESLSGRDLSGHV